MTGRVLKQIIFKPAISEEFLNNVSPQPASQHLPEWFKKFSRYLNGDKAFKLMPSGATNLSIKACQPFIDAMISGYTITLQSDIFVTDEEDGSKHIAWSYGKNDYISLHDPKQIPSKMIPEECISQPYKFSGSWSIMLPKGYSALIVHPINRYDLPFITLGGIVDLDTYHAAVQFPFLLKKTTSGTIPAGTPIAQIFPFKRESWRSKTESFDFKFTEAQDAKLKSKLEKGYKKMNWVRKTFN